MWGRSIFIANFAVFAMGGIAYAQVPPPPKAVFEAPAMGGEPYTKPGPTVINLGSNQVSLARLTNTKLVHMKKEKLGRLSRLLFQRSQQEIAPVPENIGTVKSALLNPTRNAITFAVVESGERKTAVLVPWSQLRPYDQPNPIVRTALSAQAVESAPAVSRAQPHAINIDRSVMGRAVRTTGGKNVGTLVDIIAEIGNGKVDYAIVQQRGIELGTTHAAHAVPWSAFTDLSPNKKEPITMKLDEQQWRATPVFGGSKAQETQALRNTALSRGASGPIP